VKGDLISYFVASDEHGRSYAENVQLLESPIKSVAPYAYVEQGTILPPGTVSSHRSDATYIQRPDFSNLFVRFEDIVTEGGDRVRAGESLPCTYRVERWGTTKFMQAARGVTLFEQFDSSMSDEEMLAREMENVKPIE